MIESLACGTPVIAYAHGSVPEIIEHGRSGFLVDSIGAAVNAVQRLHELSRAECRRAFEQRFTAERMAADYVEVYRAVLDGQMPAHLPRAPGPLQARRIMSAIAQRSPDPYHIASHSTQADADASFYTLNHADTFAVLDRWGDADSRAGGSLGFYHRDTRYLSRLQAHLNGVRPVLLTSTVADDNLTLVVDLTNEGSGELPKDALHLRKCAAIHAGCCEILYEIGNYDMQAHEVELAIALDADFRDIFEVRGMHRHHAGPHCKREPAGEELRFEYTGLDQRARTTHLKWSSRPARARQGTARFRWHLQPGERASLTAILQFRRTRLPAARRRGACASPITSRTGTSGCRISKRPPARCNCGCAAARRILPR